MTLDSGPIQDINCEHVRLIPTNFITPVPNGLNDTNKTVVVPNNNYGGSNKNKPNILLGYDYVDADRSDAQAQWETVIARKKEERKKKSAVEIKSPETETKDVVPTEVIKTERKLSITSEIRNTLNNIITEVTKEPATPPTNSLTEEEIMRQSLITLALKKYSPEKKLAKLCGPKSPRTQEEPKPKKKKSKSKDGDRKTSTDSNDNDDLTKELLSICQESNIDTPEKRKKAQTKSEKLTVSVECQKLPQEPEAGVAEVKEEMEDKVEEDTIKLESENKYEKCLEQTIAVDLGHKSETVEEEISVIEHQSGGEQKPEPVEEDIGEPEKPAADELKSEPEPKISELTSVEEQKSVPVDLVEAENSEQKQPVDVNQKSGEQKSEEIESIQGLSSDEGSKEVYKDPEAATKSEENELEDIDEQKINEDKVEETKEPETGENPEEDKEENIETNTIEPEIDDKEHEIFLEKVDSNEKQEFETDEKAKNEISDTEKLKTEESAQSFKENEVEKNKSREEIKSEKSQVETTVQCSESEVKKPLSKDKKPVKKGHLDDKTFFYVDLNFPKDWYVKVKIRSDTSKADSYFYTDANYMLRSQKEIVKFLGGKWTSKPSKFKLPFDLKDLPQKEELSKADFNYTIAVDASIFKTKASKVKKKPVQIDKSKNNQHEKKPKQNQKIDSTKIEKDAKVVKEQGLDSELLGTEKIFEKVEVESKNLEASKEADETKSKSKQKTPVVSKRKKEDEKKEEILKKEVKTEKADTGVNSELASTDNKTEAVENVKESTAENVGDMMPTEENERSVENKEDNEADLGCGDEKNSDNPPEPCFKVPTIENLRMLRSGRNTKNSKSPERDQRNPGKYLPSKADTQSHSESEGSAENEKMQNTNCAHQSENDSCTDQDEAKTETVDINAANEETNNDTTPLKELLKNEPKLLESKPKLKEPSSKEDQEVKNNSASTEEDRKHPKRKIRSDDTVPNSPKKLRSSKIRFRNTRNSQIRLLVDNPRKADKSCKKEPVQSDKSSKKEIDHKSTIKENDKTTKKDTGPSSKVDTTKIDNIDKISKDGSMKESSDKSAKKISATTDKSAKKESDKPAKTDAKNIEPSETMEASAIAAVSSADPAAKPTGDNLDKPETNISQPLHTPEVKGPRKVSIGRNKMRGPASKRKYSLTSSDSDEDDQPPAKLPSRSGCAMVNLFSRRLADTACGHCREAGRFFPESLEVDLSSCALAMQCSACKWTTVRRIEVCNKVF